MLAGRPEVHQMPKHRSWPDIAEIELRAVRGQYLIRQIPDLATMRKRVQAWEQDRNNRGTAVDQRFSIRDARIRRDRPYPQRETGCRGCYVRPAGRPGGQGFLDLLLKCGRPVFIPDSLRRVGSKSAHEGLGLLKSFALASPDAGP